RSTPPSVNHPGKDGAPAGTPMAVAPFARAAARARPTRGGQDAAGSPVGGRSDAAAGHADQRLGALSRRPPFGGTDRGRPRAARPQPRLPPAHRRRPQRGRGGPAARLVKEGRRRRPGQAPRSVRRPVAAGGAVVLVLPDRIELSTSPLPRECSTTELRQ